MPWNKRHLSTLELTLEYYRPISFSVKFRKKAYRFVPLLLEGSVADGAEVSFVSSVLVVSCVLSSILLLASAVFSGAAVAASKQTNQKMIEIRSNYAVL